MKILTSKSELNQTWILEDTCPETIKTIRENYELSYLTSSVLAKRLKFEEIESFINPKLKNNLLNATKLHDIEKATQLILSCIEKNQTIGILGDYDVDGITATLMWQEFLEKLNIKTKIWLPNRIDGYGPSDAAISFFEENPVDLLILVDCGSSSHEFFKKYTKPSIVIDHHKIESIPNANAIINPHREDQNILEVEEFLVLCAAGLSFLVIYHILKQLNIENNQKKQIINESIELAALGTICDIMELNAFNRSLVKKGLKVLEEQKRPGIKYMIQLTKTQLPLTTKDIGFFIGPRLNAAGRMKSAKIALELLATKCEKTALSLAQEIELLNKERKDVQNIVFQEAIEQAAEQKDAKIICIASKHWHTGIIGIIAAMIKEQLNKAVIIGNIENDSIKASARSDNLNIGQIIQTATSQKIINSGGGHARAGGLSCTLNQWDNFKKWINENIDSIQIQPQIKIDASITLEQIEDDFKILGPFGPGFEEITILTKNLIIKNFYIQPTYTRIVLEQNNKSYTYFLNKRKQKLIDKLEDAHHSHAQINILLKLSEKKYHSIEDFVIC